VERRRADGEDLAHWARQRAPALIARAEQEAVAALSDALIDAALRSGQLDAGAEVGRTLEREPHADASTAPPAARAAPASDDRGELLWVYCVLRAREEQPLGLSGVHESGAVERVVAAGLAALVSRVPRAQFGPEPLRRNLNDLGWLERVARGHEAVLEAALATNTIVPLRMCTLYESVQGVRDMLESERDTLAGALESLDGRVEWAVKLVVDTERLLDAARARSGQTAPSEDELDGRGEGGAYMLRRRGERRIRELASALASELADQVHARLADWAIDAVTRPAQNPELSGHEGEMLLNGAYLVERDRTEELQRLVEELEEQHRELGARIELTGPWPPYNFVPGGDTAALA
jgi:hypothetical protein